MYGIRVMKWTPPDPSPSSVYTGTPWPEARQHAVCRQGTRHPDQPTPAETCSCGIYALRSFWLAEAYNLNTMGDLRFHECSKTLFAALVDGFGKVVLHETGWRAADAEIVGVCTFWRQPPEDEALSLAIAAASFYHVPLLHSWDVIQLLRTTQTEYFSEGIQGGVADAVV